MKTVGFIKLLASIAMFQTASAEMNPVDLGEVHGNYHEEWVDGKLERVQSSEPVQIVNHVSYDVPDAEYEDEFVDAFGHTITKKISVHDGLENIEISNDSPWEDGEVAVIMSEIMVGSLKMHENMKNGIETD